MSKKVFWIIASIILVIGFFVRVVNIAQCPSGLNQDEASIGYEAFSLSNFGVDRNNQRMPVHFIAWGSGQNALYAYLAIPFIKILGNTALSIRLPMALIGCLTLVVALVLINSFKIKPHLKLLLLGLVVIMPWHIVKSRWGLESNLFPDLVFYATVLGYFAIKKKNPWLGVGSAVVLGLSTYAYGTSYVFVPILLISGLIFLVCKKIVNYKIALAYVGITALVALPMMLFVIINYFNLDSIQILGFTIPKLDYNRFTTITSVNGNFFTNCVLNLKNSLGILWFQEDGLPLNYVPGFGIFYMFSMPFIIYGFVISFTKKYRSNLFLIANLATLVAAFAVMLMTDPNINRVNVLWLPLLVYLSLGIMDLSQKNKVLMWTLVGLYSLSFFLFVVHYFGTYQIIINAEKSSYDRLFLAPEIGEPYIYFLYYTGYNTNDFYNERIIADRNTMFQKVEQVGNVYFSIPSHLEAGDYLIAPSSVSIDMDENVCTKDISGNYSIIDCTK